MAKKLNGILNGIKNKGVRMKLLENHEEREQARADSFVAYYLEKAILSLAESHGHKNDGCFPLYSYGWKDADLEPWGCTGIKKIAKMDEDHVLLTIGGHKTFCDPTYECEYELTEKDEEDYSTEATEIVCDVPYEGYWSGDDWSVHFEEDVQVEWVYENDELSYLKTAERAIEICNDACRPFSEKCMLASASMSALYKKMDDKYGGADDSSRV